MPLGSTLPHRFWVWSCDSSHEWSLIAWVQAETWEVMMPQDLPFCSSWKLELPCEQAQARLLCDEIFLDQWLLLSYLTTSQFQTAGSWPQMHEWVPLRPELPRWIWPQLPTYNHELRTFFFLRVFIYLAALGLPCSPWDFSLQCTDSLVAMLWA